VDEVDRVDESVDMAAEDAPISFESTPEVLSPEQRFFYNLWMNAPEHLVVTKVPKSPLTPLVWEEIKDTD
jgi:hypothetical protein